MRKERAQFPVKDIIARHYKLGDEAKILDFLNLCYGEWGTIEKWCTRYTKCPTASEDSVILMEANDGIIGHGGTILRDLIVWKRKLHTASLSDAAIHPRCRRKGLYARLVDMRLKAAKTKGACLAFTWHIKGSDAYNHNKKIGFIEVKQFPVYMKAVRPANVIKSGLLDLLHKNQRLKEVLKELEVDFRFRIGKLECSVAELLGRVDKKPKKDRSRIEIIIDENSLFVMTNFRNMSKIKRLTSIILLILLGRAKVRFSSFKALLNIGLKGVAIIDSI